MKGPVGRPKHPIDWNQVDQLCKMQCTQEEVASVVGCCLDTLQNRCNDENGVGFSEFFAQKKLGGKASLRRNQWQLAEEGNPTMLIWLGKNMLDQTDKHSTDITSGGEKIKNEWHIHPVSNDK